MASGYNNKILKINLSDLTYTIVNDLLKSADDILK